MAQPSRHTTPISPFALIPFLTDEHHTGLPWVGNKRRGGGVGCVFGDAGAGSSAGGTGGGTGGGKGDGSTHSSSFMHATGRACTSSSPRVIEPESTDQEQDDPDEASTPQTAKPIDIHHPRTPDAASVAHHLHSHLQSHPHSLMPIASQMLGRESPTTVMRDLELAHVPTDGEGEEHSPLLKLTAEQELRLLKAQVQDIARVCKVGVELP